MGSSRNLGFLLLALSLETAGQTSPLVYVYGRADFPASNGGLLATSGDFNRDQRPDLVAISYESNSAAVLLGQPDGSFDDGGRSYPVGSEPVGAAVGDFNGDGILDLVVANQICPPSTEPCPPGSISILLGNGDGTFADHADYETAADPVAVVVGDFNGDGIPDVAVAAAVSRINSGSPGFVSILLGNGDGTFQPHLDSPAGTGVIALVAGDFNGDGLLDLVVDNHPSFASHTVSLLVGNGDGTFQPPSNVTASGDPVAIAAADFNLDQKLDLAVATGTGSISILLGNGDGTFQPFVDYPGGFGPFRMIATDLNQDGMPDLALSITTNIASHGAVSLLLGNGDGSFRPRLEYATGNFGQIIADDFNGDVKVDLAVGNTRSTVTVLLGEGDGTFPHATEYASGQGPAAIVMGDFNRDGVVDLAVANSACNCPRGSVSIFLGIGDGTFTRAADFPTGTEPTGLTVADFNLDGKLDLAVANAGDNTVSILLGNGDGTFLPAMDFATGTAPHSVIAVDFNLDGLADLAVTNLQAGSVSILIGNGNGTFNPRVDYDAGPGAAGIVAADFNRDGLIDLAVADSNTPIRLGDRGRISILLGNGNGTFQSHADSFSASLRPFDLVAGDFDGDGQLDLAVTTNLNEIGTVSILRGAGDGTFEMTTNYSTGRSARGIAAGDFNLDGKLDLAIVNVNTNTLAILKGKGDGTFQSQSRYGAGILPIALVAGDFNSDGALDVAIANLGSNTISVFIER